MKKYSILLLIAVLFAGCNDFLDLPPKNVQGIETVEDVRSLMGAYLKYVSDYNTTNYVDESFVLPWSGTTYNYTTCYSGQTMFNYISDRGTGELTNFGLGYYNWQTKYTYAAWGSCYKTIGPMNLIVDKATEHSADNPDMANTIIGEAKFWRAYSYFNLLQQYAPYDSDADGVPLFFEGHIDPVQTDLPRNTQTEVYAQIVSDLQDVLNLLNQTPADLTYNIGFNTNVVNGLMAKVYQYKADSGAGVGSDWENARKYADIAIAGRALYTDAAQLREMFNAADDGYIGKECDMRVIFHEVRIKSYYGDWPDYTTDPQMEKLYQDGDIRKEAYYNEVEDWWTGDIFLVMDKFSCYDWASTANFLPIMPFRLAELYLIKAEAQAKNNDVGSAIETINGFRDARYSGGHLPVVGTQEQVLDSIMMERKREFSFEYGIAWFDMKRTHAEMTRTWEVADEEGTIEVQTYQLEGDDFRYTFPLPDSEILHNQSIDQDPRWEAIFDND